MLNGLTSFDCRPDRKEQDSRRRLVEKGSGRCYKRGGCSTLTKKSAVVNVDGTFYDQLYKKMQPNNFFLNYTIGFKKYRFDHEKCRRRRPVENESGQRRTVAKGRMVDIDQQKKAVVAVKQQKMVDGRRQQLPFSRLTAGSPFHHALR